METTPPPLPEPAKPKQPEIGDVNILEPIIGQRGSGKTTFQCERAWELSRMWGGAYVIGHSMGPRFPRELPTEVTGGRRVVLPITYHATLRELAQGLVEKPARWHILAPPLPDELDQRPQRRPDTADDLLRFAVRLSTSLRKRAWKDAHPFLSLFKRWNPNVEMLGLPCTPIIVMIDEGIAVHAAGAGRDKRTSTTDDDGHDSDWFLKLLYSLRHLHIALLWNLQEPSSRSWRILEAATTIYVYRSRHQFALNAIRAAGADEEQIDQVKRLKRFKSIAINPSDFEDDDDLAELEDESSTVKGTSASSEGRQDAATSDPQSTATASKRPA